ncbi:unnamed protein product, partial [Symbiodinium microadriaticum]
TEKGKGVGDLSDITDSSNRAMEVDEGAPIRNPKAEAYVPKLPVIDGARMGKGRRSEIEGWADFFEQFLPWIALFDDRIPEELHRAIATETTVKQSALDKGQSVRSTRTFLYLKQAMQNFSRGVDIIRQVEKEQLGSPAGYECVRRLHQELSVGSRIEASTLRTEILQFKSSTPSDHPLDCFRNVQLEMSRFARLTQGFPDLALSEADKCMVILRNLDNDIKRYVLLHARKGDHANPLQWKENKGKVAAVSLEPQLFAVALECPVVALDAEDSCSELSDEDWGGFVSAYESSWLDPEVALEGGEPVVVLGDSGVAPVELEDITVELAEPLEFSHRIPVELAEPIEFSHRIPVELGCCHEEGRCSHEHGMVAHETALASTQQHAMDWWLVDSGASAHIVNEETLQMGRKNPGDSSSSSGEPEWRLAGKSHLVKADAMSSTKVVRDFEDSLVAVTGTSMIGTEKANNVILTPADKAKAKERRAVAKAKAIAAAQKVAEQITQKREKERAEKIAAEEAQWAKEAEEVQKKRKKVPEPTGSSKEPDTKKVPEASGSSKDRIEGPGYSFPAPPSVPPRRRLPTPPRAPITPETKAMPRSQKSAPATPSERSWSVVSNPKGTAEVEIEGIVYNVDDLGSLE